MRKRKGIDTQMEKEQMQMLDASVIFRCDLKKFEWPTADVVPVVRCKDCKFRDEDAFCTGRGYPYQLVPDDGFCDKGKKE